MSQPITRRALAAAMVLSGAAAGAKPAPRLEPFDSPAAALATLLGAKPRVIAFGEYHQIEGAPAVRSSLRHFIDELLPTLAPLATDLILETWVTEGRCGKKEKEVVAKVEEDTQRPKATEDELVTVIEHAKAAGVQPHILTLSCLEYLLISGGKDGIDYIRLLATITDKLRDKIDEVLGERRRQPDKLVLVYGGALHNDLYPRKELRDYSFAKDIQRKVKGRYLEVDVYVPEYIEKDEEVTAEAWYAAWAKMDTTKTVLVRRGAGSYIIVFARGSQPPPPVDGGAAPPAARSTPVGRDGGATPDAAAR
jgi:hypothetical protein